MKTESRLIMALVAAVSVLATLVLVQWTGARPVSAQDSGRAGFLIAIAGQNYRTNSMPLVIVDAQTMTVMTYRYDLSTPNMLTLTNVRSFKYDRKLMDYNYKKSKPADRSPKRLPTQGDSVRDILKASYKLKPYN